MSKKINKATEYYQNLNRADYLKISFNKNFRSYNQKQQIL